MLKWLIAGSCCIGIIIGILFILCVLGLLFNGLDEDDAKEFVSWLFDLIVYFYTFVTLTSTIYYYLFMN